MTAIHYPRLIAADKIRQYRAMPDERRHAIMMGWVDPLTMPPIYAACSDFRLEHVLSEARAFGIHLWHKPEVLGPLIAECTDIELRRVLEAALARANPGHGS